MLVLYSMQDCFGGPSSSWMDDQIAMVWHTRSDIFDAKAVEKYCLETDGEPGKPVGGGSAQKFLFRHCIPYQRIFKAIEDYILAQSMTRAQAYKWLYETTYKLGLQPDEFLAACGNPAATRRGYDIWIDWAVSSICQWQKNIFYGPGTGDGGGTKIDIPQGPVNGAAQKIRVIEAGKQLQQVLPTLSLDDEIKLERNVFKWTKKAEKQDMQLEAAEHAYMAEEYFEVSQRGIWADYASDDDEDFDPRMIDPNFGKR